MKRTGLKLICFILFSAVAIWMAYLPLRDLLRSAKQPEYYSHVPLVPVISAYFIFRKRKGIFLRSDSFYFPGLSIMAAGVALVFIGRGWQANPNDYASIAALSALFFESGSLIFLFGKEALRRAYFPFAFLIFAIPIPSVLMERIIATLVAASTSVTHVLFKVIRVPFLQEGSVFHLPDLSLEVSQECSGIRSSLALLITTILAGHLFLGKSWNKAMLALAVFPVAVFKNGLRILSLYLLSYFIDMRFIEGSFHHKFGGSVFFGLGLILMGFFLWLLRRSERPRSEDVGRNARQLDSI
jgi:exosortase